MRRTDELHPEHPFAGSRMPRGMPELEGRMVGRRRAGRPMKKTGIEALYRKPGLGRRHAAHPICPHLLRNLETERPNPVRATGIPYIPMRRCPVYLVAAIGRYSRKALSRRFSNTPTTDFCPDAAREAIARYGTPEIFNTDRGSQLASHGFTRRPKDGEIRISMGGKGCWRDNVFVERLGTGVKREEALRPGIGRKSQSGRVHEFLQHPPAVPAAWRQDARYDPLRRPAAREGRGMMSGLPGGPLAARLINQRAAAPWITLRRKATLITEDILSNQTGQALST